MTAPGNAYDVVFLVSNEDLQGIRTRVGDYVETELFAARYPRLRTAVIRFADPTSRVEIGDDRCVVTQDRCGPVDLARSGLFVYLPASFEPEDVALRPPRPDDPDGHYVHRQWRVIAEYLEAALPRFGLCVNEPTRARAGCNKLIQRQAAVRAGVPIPSTVVTNDAQAAARAFARGTAVTKYVSETGRRDGATRTRFLDANVLAAPGFDAAPAIFQAYVAADVEYRIYVMNDDVLPVRIATPDRARDPDMRFHVFTDDDFSVADGLAEHAPMLRRYARELGLRYAVFDALPASNELLVTEVNTNGTWFQWPAPIRTLVAERFHGFVHRLAIEARR